MEKLKLSHLAPYLPYGLKCQIIETGNFRKLLSVNANESVLLSADEYNPFSYTRYKPITGIKPLLRPLSDLYKEIDGKVGIVELAKICNQDFKWEKHLNLAAIYGKYSFEYIEDGIYFVLSELGCRLSTPNQLDLFTYLFSHHYDVYGLIDKGLAIDINSVSHE